MRLRGETVGEITACGPGHARGGHALGASLSGDRHLRHGRRRPAHPEHLHRRRPWSSPAAGIKVAKHGNRAMSSKSGAADVLMAWASISRRARRRTAGRWTRPTSASCSPRPITAPCATSRPSARSWAFAPSSICWVRWPIRPGPSARCWACSTAVGSSRWRRSWGLWALSAPGSCTARAWTKSPPPVRPKSPNGAKGPCACSPSRRRPSVCERAALADLQGGDPAFNARAIRDLLDGAEGPYRSVVLLNAAAALLVAERVETLREGVAEAARVIDHGLAKAALERLIQSSNG